MMQVGKGRRKDHVNKLNSLTKAYHNILPISEAKYNDLEELCNKKKPVIPTIYHKFYKDLHSFFIRNWL